MDSRDAKSRFKFWPPSPMGNVYLFAVLYLIFILACHFDIRRHGPSFQHPIPWRTSALLALIPAAISFAVKIEP